MNSEQLADSKLISLSEIFPLTILSPKLVAFRLTPNAMTCDRELGNRLSFHLGRQFPQIVITWHQGDFFALVQPNESVPTAAEWRTALEQVRAEVQDISDRPWAIQWIRQPQLAPIVFAELACQVLQMNAQFSRISVFSVDRVVVSREVEFWAETITVSEAQPAIALSVHSDIGYRGTLAEFYETHPLRHDPEKLLVGLHVQDLETRGHGVITEIVGTIDQKRQFLLQKATGAVSQQALREASDDQPVVGVRFGRNRKVFEYAIAALRPRITEDTAARFEVQYGQLLRSTKVPHLERTQLLKTYKQEAAQALATYGFQIQRSVNSGDYPAVFSRMPQSIDQTPLLFGKGYIGTWGQILTGLKKGGVYYRHSDFRSRPIQISVLKLCDVGVNQFLKSTQYCLKQYGFESEIIDRKALLSEGSNDANARADLEKALNETAAFSPDVVLIFLPQHDRKADQETSGSFYQLAYSQLL
ncbi:MAG: stem cell self-renewal protein Piwi, partial [Phormidesmis sp. CAN_BIN36]|nr:stem cell self-renewal protein Piwi [Phormidesmis sp. CAN_BIN36]